MNDTEMIADLVKVGETRITESLREAAKDAKSELALDFGSIKRLDSEAVAALRELADCAERKNIRVVLYSVNVDLYKVLKLVNLTPRFSFVNEEQ